MTDTAPQTPARPLLSRSFRLKVAVGALLAAYAVMSLFASTHKGPSFDEPAQLQAGYSNWLRGDFRTMGGRGDFLKRWATMPYLFSRPYLPTTENVEYVHGIQNALGFQFFFQSGSQNMPEMLLLQGRVMVVLLGVGLGLLIFVCAREVAGVVGGLATLTLYAFSPNMLAFGAMVTTEIPLCLALLGSTWSIWRLLHRITWGRLAGSLGFFAMLALSRPSGMVIFPIALLLLGTKLILRRPLEWRLVRARIISQPLGQTAIAVGLCLLHLLVAWAAIWANYDFRYSANPYAPASAASQLPPPPNISDDTLALKLLAQTSSAHLLPEGFVNGVQDLLISDDTRQTFLDGDWNAKGWSGFLLAAAWEKTSPALALILTIGLSGWIVSLVASWRSWSKPTNSPAHEYAINNYEAIPYFILAASYFILVAAETVDFGQRSVLPGFPSLYILGGIGATWAWSQRARWVRALLITLLLWRSSEALSIYPNFLAYFNPLVGGPADGYQHLVDKSLDWGMDLPSLQAYLEKFNPGNKQPVYLAYFGTDNPDYYGIQARRMAGFPDWVPHGRYPILPGIFVISSTLYQTLYTAKVGPWNKVFEEQYLNCLRNLTKYEATLHDPTARKALESQYPPGYWDNMYTVYDQLRFARLCSWLRHHEGPHAYAGYSILIWKLDAKQLHAALESPPSELTDSPL